MVSHIRIDVVSIEGALLLGETHSNSFGTEGLLGVPKRLGVNSPSMLCFSTKDEAGEFTNKAILLQLFTIFFLPGRDCKYSLRC